MFGKLPESLVQELQYYKPVSFTKNTSNVGRESILVPCSFVID